jgi:hypothetical protein
VNNESLPTRPTQTLRAARAVAHAAGSARGKLSKRSDVAQAQRDHPELNIGDSDEEAAAATVRRNSGGPS